MKYLKQTHGIYEKILLNLQDTDYTEIQVFDMLQYILKNTLLYI